MSGIKTYAVFIMAGIKMKDKKINIRMQISILMKKRRKHYLNKREYDFKDFLGIKHKNFDFQINKKEKKTDYLNKREYDCKGFIGI